MRVRNTSLPSGFESATSGGSCESGFPVLRGDKPFDICEVSNPLFREQQIHTYIQWGKKKGFLDYLLGFMLLLVECLNFQVKLISHLSDIFAK